MYADRQDELILDTTLTSEAIVVLQKFTKEFLEVSFNSECQGATKLTVAWIESVMKDIRMERSKVRPTDNIRTLFVSSVFIEYLLILRQKALTKAEEAAKDATPEDKKEIKIKLDQDIPLGLAVEMIDITSLKWITARMRISMEEKPPAWTELQAAIDCFTQVVSHAVRPMLTFSCSSSSPWRDRRTRRMLRLLGNCKISCTTTLTFLTLLWKSCASTRISPSGESLHIERC